MSYPRTFRHRTASPLHRASKGLRIEKLESRDLMSAIPLGATAEDTGEFFLGRVGVVPVFFESNGQIDANTENWTPDEIDAALAKIRTGVEWWSEALDALGTVHTLEFVIDETFARNPFPTPYEPISRTSQETSLYISPFLQAQGIGHAVSLEDAVRQFNHENRLRLETDWAFTIFLLDSSDDEDGQFAPGSEFSIAFAFAGGLYLVSPSTRPASTITHETGHIFWARDEYPGAGSWTDRRGYYNAQNLNAADNPTEGFVQENSIMRAGTPLAASFNSRILPASTRAMIGWLDSDGDGIFDVADVPLHFEGSGRYDPATGRFAFNGNARAVPLPNRNSSGPQNDITLNRVDRIEYRIDGGAWQTAAVVGTQQADVAFELVLEPFDVIDFRAIDDSVGVTSPVLTTTSSAPLVSRAAIGGYAFVNSAAQGEASPLENLLSNVTVTVSKPDGQPLFGGSVEPDDFPFGPLPSSVTGATLTASGVVVDGRVGAFTSPAATGTVAFRYFNLQTARWQNDWAVDRQLRVEFQQSVGRVEISAVGINQAGSFGRLEAYDAAGTLLTRFTTDELAVGQNQVMVVEDVAGRIASVRAFGHQFSTVGLDALKFGSESTFVTGSDGVFRFPGLSDGEYQISLSPERLIHQYTGNTRITVSGGVATPIAAAFERVVSPWLNVNNPYDVDGNGLVQPLDALRIINDLSRNGTRNLSDPSAISLFVDTSNDGVVSALDALRVINELSRRHSQNGGGEGEAVAADAIFALWDPDLEKETQPDAIQVFTYSTEQNRS
jgi:hypothetical protein